ncbi:MAG TPA: mycofactocin precursor MftA [Acidimicrobiales bacterium]|nr:mycofactocin precursor MftA [Acidimicrobiales bacterium]
MTDPVTEHRDPSPDTADAAEEKHPLVEAELLVEDVSIDGMCGVY